MRTTLREKAVLWVNGLTIAIGAELIIHGQIDPLSLTGVALLGPILLCLGAFTIWAMHRSK